MKNLILLVDYSLEPKIIDQIFKNLRGYNFLGIIIASNINDLNFRKFEIFNWCELNSDFLESNKVDSLLLSLKNPRYYFDFLDVVLPKNLELLTVNYLGNELSIKKLELSDLISDQIPYDTLSEIKKYFHGKKVLITGAAGSIGRKLAIYLEKCAPEELILIDQAETPLFYLSQDLTIKEVKKKIYLADVCNASRIKIIFEQTKPNIIFHAAAYKHVPFLEDNSYEAISTNILGTKIVADFSNYFNAEKFILLSSDKAVSPISIMGFSKKMAELYVQNLNNFSRCEYIITRFGNVFGSQGSVIALFQKQLKENRPLTITNPNMTRYFMSILEACELVLLSTVIGEGGNIYVFDMGDAMKLKDFVSKILFIYNKIYKEGETVMVIGNRKGEKIKELLIENTDDIKLTKNNKIYLILQGLNKEYISLENLIKEYHLIEPANLQFLDFQQINQLATKTINQFKD